MSTNGAVIVGAPVVAAPFVTSLPDLRRAFQAGLPYRHVVIDGFLDEDLARDLASGFPSLDDPQWKKRFHRHSKKLTLDEWLPVSAEGAIDALHSDAMLRWIENLTGMQDLRGDDALFGGGLHCVPSGGFLDVHADFSRHPVTGDQRVLNLLIYLNEDWDPLWGGALELWDAGVTKCLRSIQPAFNRAVLFETHDRSFHGHPDPLACPPTIARKSLALYYYRPAKAWDLVVPTTDYRARPHDYRARFRAWAGRLKRRIT